jgi:hypothetical protein
MMPRENRTLSKENADLLVDAYRILSGMRGMGRDSVLMLAWSIINVTISRTLQHGGWRLYFNPTTEQMEIE